MKRIIGLVRITAFAMAIGITAAGLLNIITALIIARGGESFSLAPLLAAMAGFWVWGRHSGLCRAVNASARRQALSAAAAGLIIGLLLAAEDIAVFPPEQGNFAALILSYQGFFMMGYILRHIANAKAFGRKGMMTSRIAAAAAIVFLAALVIIILFDIIPWEIPFFVFSAAIALLFFPVSFSLLMYMNRTFTAAAAVIAIVYLILFVTAVSVIKPEPMKRKGDKI